MDDKIKIFYPFENVCCYAAGEGCGYYAFSEKIIVPFTGFE